MLLRLIQLIREILSSEHRKDQWRSYYIPDERPKTYGTRIRR